MRLYKGQRLAKSGLYIPDNLAEDQWTYRGSRVIWTPDGEVEIPRRKGKRGSRLFRAAVRNIVVKDETGKVILIDPRGEANTITNGAIYAMMHNLWGVYAWTNYSDSVPGYNYTDVSGNYQSNKYYYNDGTYNFPSIDVITNGYYNAMYTYQIGYSLSRVVATHFGQLWFINNVGGGLTGSHLPATITCSTGFVSAENNNIIYQDYEQGWINGNALPTVPIGTTNTTLSDSFSAAATGTPSFTHNFTLSAASNALSFTFDAITWVPIVGYSLNTTAWIVGYWAAGAANNVIPNWASASSTPTTITNLQVSAIWIPGYAITLNPGGSFGFTYTFQG